LTFRGHQKLFTRKNVIKISLIIFIISSFAQMPIISVKAESYTDISVQTAYDMINNKTLYPDLFILDVREQYEYEGNHLYNATLIPRLEIDSRISELLPYNDTEIIVYCMTGGRSALASQNLAENHNFTKIYNMLGGINTWIGAGFPVWTPPYSDISVQTAYDMINNKTLYPNLLILDVREQYEYDESHLYNATLIPRLEIDGRITELLPYNDTEIIVYSMTGDKSALASQNLAENHNFTKIYNMLGGINGWISGGFPVWTPEDGTNGQSQPTIGISLNFFFVILIGTVLFVILYAKKHRSAL